jgi:Arc/MetJ-type ribon-helix-helix transcriptional regulator
MSRTVKFTVSVPEPVFKELEALRRRTRMSRSQLVREAVRNFGPKAEKRPTCPGTEAVIRESSVRYGAQPPSVPAITDAAERRRRAIAAAGRFRSGTHDLSTEHDARLEEAYAAGAGKGSPSPAGSGRKP